MAEDILGKLGDAIILLRADGSKLSEDMKKERAKLGKQLDEIGDSLKTQGKALTAGVTAPLLAMGAAAVAAGLKLDDAFDTIRAKTGQTGASLKGLENDFKEVFTNVPDDAKTVADALSLIYQRTGQTGEGLQELTKTLVDLSRITGTEVAANVDAATRAFAAWQIKTEDQGKALDFIFKVSQQTGASVTDLMTTVTGAQGVFQTLNMSFEDSVALLGQMTKAGLDAEGSVGALKKAVATFTEAGLPAQASLKKTLELIQQLGPGTQATQLAMDVFGQKAGPQLAIAITQGKLSIEELLKTVKGSSETIKKATDDTSGFAEKFGELKNKAMVALEPLGTKLLELGERALPVLVKMGEAVGKVIEWFTKLPGPVQDVAIGIGILAAATGPVMMAVGSFTKLQSIVSILRLTELPGLNTAIGTVGPALGRLAPMFGLLGIAALSIGTGFFIAKSNMDEFMAASKRERDVAETGMKSRQKVGESWDEYIKRLRDAKDLQDKMAASTERVEIDFAALQKGLGITAEDLAKNTAKADAALLAFQNSLRSTKEKQAEAAEAARKHAEELLRLDGILEKLGIVTKTTITAALKEFTDAEKHAIAQGVSLQAFMKGFEQDLYDLREAAIKSGLGTSEIDAALKRVRAELSKTVPKMLDLKIAGVDAFKKTTAEVKLMTGEELKAWLATRDLEAAQKTFGVTSRDELKRTAEVYKQLYKTMLESGQFTTEQLAIAFQKLQEAIKAAAQGSGVAWGNIFTTAMVNGINIVTGSGSFAQKLGGIGQMIGGIISQNATSAMGMRMGSAIADIAGAAAEGIPAIMAARTRSQSTMAGMKMGASIGTAIMPGIGTAIGAGIGALAGFVVGNARNNTKRTREEFAEALGFGEKGIGKLYDDLKKLGPEGEKLANIGQNIIGRQDHKGNEKWMEDVKKFYDDVAKKKEKDAAFETSARDRLQSAIEKYGFTIDELGPKWRAQMLSEQAKELVQDFTVLTASGIGVDLVIEKMGTSVQEFVTTALRTKTEIPEAMRPMLKRMSEMGLLFDENGNAITDLETSGIKFSKTMTEGFADVVSKLDELIRKITGDLGGALGDLPKKIGIDVGYNILPNGNGVIDGSAKPLPFGNGVGGTRIPGEIPEFADGGIGNFGRGTLAVLHGREAVIPVDQMANVMRGSNGGLDAEALVAAMRAAGLGRPNINFAPVLEGALAKEMDDFASKMWPALIRVLQNDGSTRASVAGTIGVS